MNILKSAAIVAVGLLALAGCQKAAVDTTADADAIKAMVSEWNAAYNSGDAAAIAAKYADDGVVMPPGVQKAAGRDAIRELIASEIAKAQAAGVMLDIDQGEASVSGDTAWHAGSYVVNDASGVTVDSGNYLEVLRKVDGKWLIVRDIWNSDRPPAPAPSAEPAAS